MKIFKFNKPLVESKYQPSRTDVYWIDIEESTGEVLSIKEFSNGSWVDYLNKV